MFPRCQLLTLAVVMAATARSSPRVCAEDPAPDEKETAEQILKKVVEKNRFWLDPRPQNLSYTLTAAHPGEIPDVAQRVFIAGDNVRWAMDANATRYTYIF